MTAPTCVRCGRPIADGYACTAETAKAAAQLAQLADMTPAARDVAHGLSKRGGGGAGGKPGSRLPLDLTATAKLDGVQNVLTTWARHIAEERIGHGLKHTGTDPLLHAVHYLLANLEWLRHRPEVDGVLADIQAAARVVAGIARGPAPQKYLGPCGAAKRSCEGLEPEDWPEADCGNHTPHAAHEVDPCDGDVYVRGDASVGRCRLCGAEVARGDREAWMHAEVRSGAFRAVEIAGAYGINIKTIRSWATDRPPRWDHSGTLVQAGRPAKLHPHGADRDGRPLFLVGDVLDLAAADAARRAENQAKRARREDAEVGA